MAQNLYKYPVVDAGMLRHRITVQQMTEAPDSLGQMQETWNDLGTFWGLYRNLHGTEAMVAKQVKATAAGAVTFRDLPVDLNEQMRLLFDGHTLGIVNVDPYSAGDGTKRQIVCWVEEIREPPV